MVTLNINFSNKTFYLLIGILALVAVAGVAIALNSGDYSVHGHDAGEIEDHTHSVGEVQGTIGFSSLDCETKRSAVYDKDAVVWCTAERPILMNCAMIDDQTPVGTPTDITEIPSPDDCTDDGPCNTAGLRENLGGNNAYFETVQKTNGIMGCLQYDKTHVRTPYKLELICCS
tara:strand:- start:82 stop:600 length:519 start_codon:yes stop_codon:yes gene_type:complete